MSRNKSQNPLTEPPKKFYCELCDYITANKKDFVKHENTKKHQRNVTNNVTELKNVHKCTTCNESFSYRMALCRHKKKCTGEKPQLNQQEYVVKNEFSLSIQSMKELIKDVLKEQSNELKEVLKEQAMELNNVLKNNTNTTLIQNNTTNNSFNLNVFLNEQCKDAISITDFVDSLNLNVSDLEATGKLGYVVGISRIFINKLKELDVYERPLHCTDYKRETVYIKNQDTWEKDNQEKTKLKTIVNRIARKNLEQLPAWQAENPDYVTLDTPENNEFMKISLSSLGGYTREEETKQLDKIMKNVLKEVTVDKNALTDS